jgi:hypothetical protein
MRDARRQIEAGLVLLEARREANADAEGPLDRVIA